LQSITSPPPQYFDWEVITIAIKINGIIDGATDEDFNDEFLKFIESHRWWFIGVTDEIPDSEPGGEEPF